MIIPTTHRVIVKADKVEESDPVYKSARAAGIALADHSDRKREQASVDRGYVVDIGPTAFQAFYPDGMEKRPVNIGDYVAYARFSGKFITDPFTEEEFVALNDEDIICVFKETK